MSVVRPGKLLRCMFPGVIWRGDKNDHSVYLTFDDGPIPEVTPWVLDVLNEYHVKATFFCVGENVEKHPKIFERIINEGHMVGNHTFHHMNRWKNKSKAYFNDIDQAGEIIRSPLFRPPHGKIYPWNVFMLKKNFKMIVMWDVLTYDFDKDHSAEKVFDNVISNTRNGSILVFHDSVKAWHNLKEVLPKSIEWLINNKFELKLFDI